MKVPGRRAPIPGEVPLFEMNDPVLFPHLNPPIDPTEGYWQEVNRNADKMGISLSEARRMAGYPPNWPRGRALVDAVLRGEIDPRHL